MTLGGGDSSDVLMKLGGGDGSDVLMKLGEGDDSGVPMTLGEGDGSDVPIWGISAWPLASPAPPPNPMSTNNPWVRKVLDLIVSDSLGF